MAIKVLLFLAMNLAHPSYERREVFGAHLAGRFKDLCSMTSPADGAAHAGWRHAGVATVRQINILLRIWA
jgi:hypothetical protein